MEDPKECVIIHQEVKTHYFFSVLSHVITVGWLRHSGNPWLGTWICPPCSRPTQDETVFLIFVITTILNQDLTRINSSLSNTMIPIGNLDFGHLKLLGLAPPIPTSCRLWITFSWIMYDYPITPCPCSCWPPGQSFGLGWSKRSF